MNQRWEIAAAGYRATVLQAGGGLGELEHDGVPIVVPPPAEGPVPRGRGQILVPWPNRIRDGVYAFNGTTQQLPINEVAKNNASHGLARWLKWDLLEHDDTSLTVGTTLVAQSGYPWSLDLKATYSLDAAGLSLTLEATNLSDSAAPFAAGLHPYFDLGVRADDVALCVPAAAYIETDARSLPVANPMRGIDTALDFRTPRLIGETVLDHGYTDLQRDGNGWAHVEARGAQGVRVSFDAAWPWVQVFTGDTLGAEARTSVAIEPLSAPVDAFNSGIDLVRLAPGGTWQGRVRLSRAG